MALCQINFSKSAPFKSFTIWFFQSCAVEDLKSKNISAVNVGGEINYEQQEVILKEALAGKYQFIYLSPEKLAQKSFQNFLQALPITLFAIDEAHCISQWGYDFRPSYRKLDALKKMFPSIPILAMTASAIPLVQEDIIKQLLLIKHYWLT